MGWVADSMSRQERWNGKQNSSGTASALQAKVLKATVHAEVTVACWGFSVIVYKL